MTIVDKVKSIVSNFQEVKLPSSSESRSYIRIALAHVMVRAENIRLSYRGEENVRIDRRLLLNKLLNDVRQYGISKQDEKIDLLILPEVSVPHRWTQKLVQWSRRHQIGIVCGLEHRIDASSVAWNELLTVLPFIDANGHRLCTPFRRLKRHYSPHESFSLQNNQRSLPDYANAVFQNKSQYQLFHWRGSSFAVYNCYELASLEDRSIFKGKVDFLIASEYNPDVSYFSNIVESAARDLHCFVVQVNSSDFGDTRVVSPSTTESQKNNPLRLKGGDNQTFLTMALPIARLREHQRVGYGLQRESTEFKPTPPDFPLAEVMRRINRSASQS